MNLKKYDIVYDESILNWDEGLPLGNGRLGALVYGDGPLRVAIDRIDIWDNRRKPGLDEKDYNYQNLRRLVLASDVKNDDPYWQECQKKFKITLNNKTPYPTKLTPGRMELDFGKKFAAKSRVCLQTAIANVELDGGEKGIEAFVSATENVGVIKVFGGFSLDFHIPGYISGDENGKWVGISSVSDKEEGSCMAYPRADIVNEGEFLFYEQKTHTDYRYGTVILRRKTADGELVYFTVASSDDSENFIEDTKKYLVCMANKGYDALKKEHIAWWKRYWQKSEISLGDALIEKVYYRSWYLFASTSRRGGFPMPLQGVWTADDDNIPPWKGDYHHDTNTQLSYQSYLKANRMDEGRCFVDYIWNTRENYKDYAKRFFGVKGYIIPATATVEGKEMGGSWIQYGLSPTMTIWVAQSFDEYYLYTGDETFLKKRAYPFFREVAKAFDGLLEAREDGSLYLPLSSSPEIYNDDRRAYLDMSNFDLALIVYLYRTLRGYAEKLGLDASHYEEVLSRLDDFAIDGHTLKLDRKQLLPAAHRHLSHTMCLYPLHLINYDTEENKKIYNETLWHLELLGMGKWVGFSYGMCAALYAMAERGNSAYEKLCQFARAFVAENGFHLNGDYKNYGYTTFHYRPFTLESSFGFCDALHEMLMQDHQGYLHLFPALPVDYEGREISFKKLRTVGGVLASAKAKKNKATELVLEAPREAEIRIKNTFGETLTVEQNGKTQTLKVALGEIFSLCLPKGKTKIYRA
ncbi:MAG: glycoside hydrolase N-terminal domain-containing protein [Clostridia bacterium]|nr:glycoside hydrolase N-terminal domain-containing protein [Clostridia bacterium]